MAILRVWMGCENNARHGLRPAMMKTPHDFGSCDECIYNDGRELVVFSMLVFWFDAAMGRRTCR